MFKSKIDLKSMDNEKCANKIDAKLNHHAILRVLWLAQVDEH